ncbi:hypothetical protein M9H77_04261 [Catharanthus roseus]|uniref:Uncharacterized protein n=1 Tax=Catharanthus roseus TaxID=4058 RepID=A0ACC0CDH5_CATRO|nr:hypothetical protein M9H77_04261 [Catharanthus roseus]
MSTGTKKRLRKCYAVNFKGLQVGANMVQTIKDWLISKIAFEARNFHDHVLRFSEVQKLEHLKYICFKNHHALATNNMIFRMNRSRTSLQVAHNLCHKQGLFKGATWMWQMTKLWKLLELLPTIHINAACVLGVEDKGRSMGKEFGTILKELAMSLSLIPSLMCYEVSFMQLKFFLESYLSHLSIYGDICTISLGGGFFLVVPYMSKCLSSHTFLEDSVLHNGSMVDPSCHDFKVISNASIEYIVVGFGLDDALLNILRYKCLEKLFEDVDYEIPFLDYDILRLGQVYNLFLVNSS